KLVIDSCNDANIDTKNILVIKGQRTGMFLQVQDKNNDMHMALCDMSVSKNIDLKYIASKDKLLKKASAIVLDPSLDLEVIEHILKVYNKVPVFVDPISDLYAKKIKPYLTKIYCIKPNKSELQVLSGIKIKNKNDVLKAFNKVNNYIDKLYVSVGKDGCVYENVNNQIVMRKFKPVKKMANASGAGDALMAALLYGYVHDLNVEKTIDYALAAGICSIQDEHTINPNLSIKLFNKIIKENKL
ncbi:MAG: PfkB family carbohydrate kinase, partial [Bacillota bacterium]|nr:PfkB family carbohydrate kinase [Bacillota bacterium]